VSITNGEHYFPALFQGHFQRANLVSSLTQFELGLATRAFFPALAYIDVPQGKQNCADKSFLSFGKSHPNSDGNLLSLSFPTGKY
jgi:hypothetical protein